MAEALSPTDMVNIVQENLELLGNSMKILGLLENAEEQIKTLRRVAHTLPRDIPAPSGYQYEVNSDQEDGTLSVGKYWPREINTEAVIKVEREDEVAPFIGSLLVTTGDVFLVVRDIQDLGEFNTQACVVPNPPQDYLSLIPTE